MIYIIFWTVIEFTAVQTEVPNKFEVQHREVTRESLLLNRIEAVTQYERVKTLAPYIGAKGVTIDSFTICKPEKKALQNGIGGRNTAKPIDPKLMPDTILPGPIYRNDQIPPVFTKKH